MKERFRDFAGISNLNHFLSNQTIVALLLLSLLIRIIHICRCLFIVVRQNFKSIISCSEHKALRFLSFVQFTVLLICFKP